MKLIDVFTKTRNNFVVLDRILSSYYCSPKYFENDVNAKIYAKENYVFQRVVIMLFDMEQYIASYKHLIGCEVCDYDYGSFTICSVSKNDNGGLFFNGNENEPFDSLVSFYLDDENIGTYDQYMQLHYPEYEHIWKHQL